MTADSRPVKRTHVSQRFRGCGRRVSLALRDGQAWRLGARCVYVTEVGPYTPVSPSILFRYFVRRQNGFEQTIGSVRVSNLTTREVSQPRVFHPTERRPRRDAQ